jgi:hypothetical protein
MQCPLGSFCCQPDGSKTPDYAEFPGLGLPQVQERPPPLHNTHRPHEPLTSFLPQRVITSALIELALKEAKAQAVADGRLGDPKWKGTTAADM